MFRRQAVIAHVFGLDLRSLALLRISLGLLLLYDLAIRATDLTLFYSEDGFQTIRDSIRQAGLGAWSLYWLSGDVRFTIALFVVTAAAVVGLILGWRTTAMTILCWLLTVSLQNRNLLLINGGDVWLRLILMWGVFLPWGAAWSVDARQAHKQGFAPPSNFTVSAPTVCFVLQTSLVYFYGGLLKFNERWLGFNPWDAAAELRPPDGATLGGDAMQRALSYIAYSRPLAVEALEYPAALRLISFGTPFFEFFLAAAILWPFRNQRVRFWTIFAAIGFHLGIELFLYVGQFSLVAISAWLAFLPSFFWDNRGRRRFFPPAETVEAESSPVPAQPQNFFSQAKRQRSVAVFCTVLMGIILYWNAAGIFRKDIRRFLRAPLQPVANTLLLRQTWNMFSRPSGSQSRFLYAGELPDGRLVDAVLGTPLTATETLPDRDAFPNHRWRKLHAVLEDKDHEKHRRQLAEALFHRWNATHSPDEQLVRLTMYRFIVSTVDPHRPPRREIAAVVPPEPRTK